DAPPRRREPAGRSGPANIAGLAGTAEALGEGGEDGAERLSLGALGTSGPSARVPGEDVEVSPRDAPRDELLEEQGPDAGAGLLGPGPDVVEIGDLPLEQLAVGPPEGHPPEGIGLGPGVTGKVRRERVVVAEERGQLRSQRHARRAGQRGEVDDQR